MSYSSAYPTQLGSAQPTPQPIRYSSELPQGRSPSLTRPQEVPGVYSQVSQISNQRDRDHQSLKFSSMAQERPSHQYVSQTGSVGQGGQNLHRVYSREGEWKDKRHQQELFKSWMNSNDNYTQDIRKIIGYNVDNTLDITDALVHAHEGLNQPGKEYLAVSHGEQLRKAHSDLIRESNIHRENMSKIMQEVKKFVPPHKNEKENKIMNNAFEALSKPNDLTEKTGEQFRELSDDIAIILDPQITGEKEKKPIEKLTAPQKFAALHPAHIVTTGAPTGSSTVRIKLDPVDKYLTHEVSGTLPPEKVNVIVDRPPKQIVQAPTTSYRSVVTQPYKPLVQAPIQTRTYSPPPPTYTHTQTYRPASPSPVPQTSTRTVVSSVKPSPPPVIYQTVITNQQRPVDRKKTPSKQKVTTGINLMEEIQPTEPEEVFEEEEIQRSFIPASNSKPKIRQNIEVITEEVKVPEVKARKREALYDEIRHPYLKDIEGRSDFINNYESTSFEAGDPYSKKLELSHNKEALYLGGLNGLTKMNHSKGTLSQVQSIKSDRPTVSMKRNSKNHLLLQQPQKNDLYAIDSQNLERERTPGRLDTVAGNEAFRHFRHSLDDKYILWRNGNKDLDVYDCETMETDETISDFWVHEGKSSVPVCGVSNREVSKILGLGNKDLNTQTLHYLEKDSDGKNHQQNFLVKDLFPKMSSFSTMEINQKGDRVYLAGIEPTPRGDKPKLISVSFDKQLKLQNSMPLTSEDYKRVNRIRRVKGEDVLVLGCDKHFSVVEDQQNQLKEIGPVKDIHSGPILDFEMHDKFLFSRGDKESDVKVTTFGIEKKPPEIIAPVEAKPPEILAPIESKPVVYETTKYEKFVRFKIDCSFITESFEKIAVGAKGNQIYAGGKGLYIFEKDKADDTKFKVLTYEGNKEKRFFGMKATRSGHILMQEAVTNDLVVLDHTGDEILRHKGFQKARFEQTAARNPHFSGEVDSVVWFGGTTSLAIVSLKDLSFNEIQNFLPTYGTGKDGLPIRAVMKDGGRKMLVFFVVENQPSFAFMSTELQEPDIYLADEILPKFQNIVDIETSLNRDIVFVGGSSHPNPQTKKMTAMITALRFDKSLSVIDTMEFKDKDPTVVYTIKRAHNDHNTLFLGCLKHVNIVEWRNNSFVHLMIAVDLHSNLIYDICLFGQKLYTVGRKDRFISIVDFKFDI